MSDSLREAAERYTKGYPSITDQCHADTIALADFLSGMPEGKDLPPGPWVYDEESRWIVFSAAKRRIVEMDMWSEKDNRAVASLLVWARGVVEISKQQSASAGE